MMVMCGDLNSSSGGELNQSDVPGVMKVKKDMATEESMSPSLPLPHVLLLNIDYQDDAEKSFTIYITNYRPRGCLIYSYLYF